MTTTPDSKLVHEIAEDAMRGAIADGMFWHVNQAVGDHGVPGLVFKGSTFEVYRTAAIAEYKRMADALPWSDEHPQDDGDAQLADLATELDAANDDADEIADRASAYREEIMRLRARVRELEGAQDGLDGDARVIAELLEWVRCDYERDRMRDGAIGFSKLAAFELHFADRIAALEARDAKAVG